MSWSYGIPTYVIIWWLVLFAVLPFGVRPSEEGDPGFGSGAPANPRLPLKALVTTLIAGVIWGIAYWAVAAGYLDFHGDQ